MARLIWIVLYISVTRGTVHGDICDDLLLPTIPDSHITVSSTHAQTNPQIYSGPERARLNRTETTLNNGTKLAGGWMPAGNSAGEYIQAIFDDVTFISDVITQGQNGGSGHVTLYKMEYTEDGKTWQPTQTDYGVEQIFQGNSDSDSPVENALLCPVFAKGIRIRPLDSKDHIALRFDVKGCYVDTSIIVTTPSSTTPNFLPGIRTPFGLHNATFHPVTTLKPKTTINMLTLIHLYLTAIGNTSHTTPATSAMTSPTTPATPFMPGIHNPFGTTQTLPPFNPGTGIVG